MERTWRNRSIAVVGLFSLYRLLVMGQTGLGEAEAYYWLWSRRPALSYFDHPPMVAYLIRLFNEIGGNNVFFTRLPSLVLFIGTCYLLYRLTIYLFNDARVAFWALAMFILCPVFAIGGLQIVPDIPAAFFWMLFIHIVAVILKEDRKLLWYPAGAVIGLGLLSKYMVLPLIPSTLLMLAWHREYRHHLKEPHIYLGGVLGLIIFSPVIAWNYLNDFPSFRFHLETRHVGAHFTMKHMAEALGGQLLFYSPLMWPALLYSVYLMGKKVFAEKDSRFIPLFWLSAPPLAFFLLITFWTKESEPHWTAFGFLAVFIGWAFSYLHGTGKFRKFSLASLALAFALIAVFYVQVFVPFLPMKPKYDITNLLYGWDVVGPRIEKLYGELPPDRPRFVASRTFILSGPIAFAVKDRVPVFALSKKLDQFDFFEPPEPPVGANFIFVANKMFKGAPDRYYRFDHADEPVTIEITRMGKHARTFYLYKVYGYRGMK